MVMKDIQQPTCCNCHARRMLFF